MAVVLTGGISSFVTSYSSASPESLVGRMTEEVAEVDCQKHDMWSLGCLLVPLLTGGPAFVDATVLEPSSDKLRLDFVRKCHAKWVRYTSQHSQAVHKMNKKQAWVKAACPNISSWCADHQHICTAKHDQRGLK